MCMQCVTYLGQISTYLRGVLAFLAQAADADCQHRERAMYLYLMEVYRVYKT